MVVMLLQDQRQQAVYFEAYLLLDRVRRFFPAASESVRAGAENRSLH